MLSTWEEEASPGCIKTIRMLTILTYESVYNLPLAAVLLSQCANSMDNVHTTEHANC